MIIIKFTLTKSNKLILFYSNNYIIISRLHKQIKNIFGLVNTTGKIMRFDYHWYYQIILSPDSLSAVYVHQYHQFVY